MYPGTAQFFGDPLISQERVKLQISNLASIFRGSIRKKAREKFWKKGFSAPVSVACVMGDGIQDFSSVGVGC